MKQQIAVINFNTPELTEACILSIRKHGCDWPVVVFDNSCEMHYPEGQGLPERHIKARPFTKKMNGVKVINNRKGQLVDFEKELDVFTNKPLPHAAVNAYGSDRHMITVQKLWELLPEGFILVESDILVKTDIRALWNENYSFVGYVQKQQRGNKFGIGRILPMLCYFNVPKFVAEGVRYFDPERAWMLRPDLNDRTNWYDTGASLLEDVLSHTPRLRGLHVDIRPMVEHFGSGSWHGKDPKKWLDMNKNLWSTPQTT